MLKSLYIKDYALIETITVAFEKGLNIITGETGAGKSILIDALGILLGDRATIEIIRRESSKAVIEGVFGIKNNFKVEQLLKENEIEFEEELIIRREISLKGSNRIFLNDTPASLTILKEIGDLLVDLHGQHEHQSLLKSEKHIEFLDDYLNLGSLIADYKTVLNKLNKTKNELKDVIQKESIIKEKFDLYSFQLKDIEEVSPSIEEEEKFEQELNILENSEKLTSLSGEIYSTLYDGRNSVYDNLTKVKSALDELSKIDNKFFEKQTECQSAIASVQDVAEFVRSYLNKIEPDPERLDEIRGKIVSFNRLKKKYGGSIEKVIEYKNKITNELEFVSNFSEKINDLKIIIESLKEDAGKIAKELSEKRKKGSEKLKIEIEESLKYLGINYSCFEVSIVNTVSSSGDSYILIDKEKYLYNSNGYDEVEFFISTNLGETPKPLVKVASGGEVSRIMLALKTSLAKNETLPLLIFDEIDTGVSGRIGQKVGMALKKLAGFHQIIAITHLPQIAALANNHYAVEKNQINDRVVSSVRKLSDSERVTEVAKLLSGETITETSLISAKELMEFAE